MPVAEPFADVHTIAVLRGGGLGDLLFTLPALDGLRATYPAARIVLLGTRVAQEVFADRPGPVDRVHVLPVAEGVHEPASTMAATPEADFSRAMAELDIDLACQLHGGGRYSNPFTLALGARHSIGTRTPDAAELERWLPYVYYQHEVARWLEVVTLAGVPGAITEPRLQTTAAERETGAGRWAAPGRPLLVLHPGATDPRRRWPIERFAQLARRAAGEGMTVVTVGSRADADAADAVASYAAHARVVSAADALTLSELIGLLWSASAFVGNDSGPRHLAQAVGTPTVGVFWAGNVINGAPFGRAHHRVQISWITACPVCGRDVTQVGWTAPRCAHDVSFVADIATDVVYDDLAAVIRSRP